MNNRLWIYYDMFITWDNVIAQYDYIIDKLFDDFKMLGG